MSQNDRWPDERTAQLRVLKRQGLDNETMADRLGVSREAVIGKLWRLGISAKPGDSGPPPKRDLARHRRPLRGEPTLPPLSSLE